MCVAIDISSDRRYATSCITGITNTVSVAVGLVGIVSKRAIVFIAGICGEARVAIAISVKIRTGITAIADSVLVVVLLIYVGHQGAVVTGIAETVTIGVVIGGGGGIGTEISLAGVCRESGIAEAIAVGVRALIAEIADSIAIGVDLIGVVDIRAVVVIAGVGGKSRVTEAITVGIGTGVTGITDTVAIGVGLIGIGYKQAVVARIANAVKIEVFLKRIGHVRAVVIGADILRVSGVAEPVAVGVDADVIASEDSSNKQVVSAEDAILQRVLEREIP